MERRERETDEERRRKIVVTMLAFEVLKNI